MAGVTVVECSVWCHRGGVSAVVGATVVEWVQWLVPPWWSECSGWCHRGGVSAVAGATVVECGG